MPNLQSPTQVEATPMAAQPVHTPPPLRLPKFLQAQLSRPLNTLEDVEALVSQIKSADARGLL